MSGKKKKEKKKKSLEHWSGPSAWRGPLGHLRAGVMRMSEQVGVEVLW
jgi:hypothetical protein